MSRLRWIVFVVLVLAASCVRDSVSTDAFPDPGSDTFAVAARVRAKNVALGELVQIDISTRYDKSLGFERADLEHETAFDPAWRDAAKKRGYVFENDGKIDTPTVVVQDDGSLIAYVTVGLRALRLGDVKLPPIQLRAKKADGEYVRASSEPIEISVVASLEEDANQAAEIDPAFVVDAPPAPLWPWLLGGGGLVLCALLLMLWWRRRMRRAVPEYVAPTIPADQQALARIRELERMLERGEIGGERLVVESSATLRRWLEDGLRHRSLARTTDEFLDDLRSTSQFSVAQQNRLQDFLRRCDLIKFAGQEPTMSECRDLLASVRAFVEETLGDMQPAGDGRVAVTAHGVALFASLPLTQADSAPTGATAARSFYQWQEELFGFAFADPVFLLFLLAIPLLVWLSRRPKPALGFASVSQLDALPVSARVRFAWLPRVLAILALVPLILACARPQTFERVKMETEGIDILLTIDLSSSMAARDLAKDGRETRLDVVKRVAEDFIKARADDRIGLVAFARYPDLVCPSTLDHQALLRFLEPLKHKRTVQRRGDRGDIEDGTAIGAGLALAVDRLEKLESKSRVVILLSDGEETVGEILPDAAAKLAKDAKIRVYTIGAGRGVRGPLGMIRRPDFQALRKIAQKTEGAFFEATSEEALTRVFEKIDKLERTALNDPIFAVDERFWPLLWIGFALFALAGLLRLAVFVVLP